MGIQVEYSEGMGLIVGQIGLMSLDGTRALVPRNSLKASFKRVKIFPSNLTAFYNKNGESF